MRPKSPEFFLRRQEEIKTVLSQKPDKHDNNLSTFDDMKIFSRPQSPVPSHRREKSLEMDRIAVPPYIRPLPSDMLSEQPKNGTERGFSPIAQMFFRPADSFQATTELIERDQQLNKDKIKLKATEGAKVLQ
jgi:hypothetical protein